MSDHEGEKRSEREIANERLAADVNLAIEALQAAGQIRSGERYEITAKGDVVTCEAYIFMGPFVPGADNGDPFAEHLLAQGYAVVVDPDCMNSTPDFFPCTYKISKELGLN